MESLVIPLLFAHVILYLAWKMTALDEKNSREHGHKIPTYATGGLGNLIGFSLMTTGVGFTDYRTLDELTLIGAAFFAILVTTLLHIYWQRDAIGSITSLYLPDGRATVAGWLHLLYVLFISLIIVVFLIELPKVQSFAITLFSSGVLLYALAIFIDKKRGVI